MDIVKNLKNGRAAGVDGMRAELMKYLLQNYTTRNHALKCFNKVLYENIQEDWLRSNTTMIQKTRKPKILEHRPIAVMVLSIKIMCTFFREKIEEHLKECKFGYENQYWFTKRERIEHCLLIQDYISNISYESRLREHKNLFFIFIDFKKARHISNYRDTLAGPLSQSNLVMLM